MNLEFNMVFNIGQYFFSWHFMVFVYIYIYTTLALGFPTKSKELGCAVADTENPTQTAVIAPG